ncbi:MAG: serine/threonine-protein kinase [bacterium]
MPRSFRGYELEQKIGSGGMSTLYRGIQTALNRPVAIKMLHPGLADDESFIARFEREAKAASQIGHRNIVGVIDFGVEDDIYYIIMELVTGMDMKDALEKVERLPPEIVLIVLEEVSYGLEAAHDAGVVHRDIKPSNVMLSGSGEIKVADFGLARQQSDIAVVSALTMAGTVLGTPAYMSPEQAAGKEVDGRTDIFSLGVMGYELLTGEKPFAGSTYSEIREKIINHDPPPIGANANVTPEIEALIRRMLEKDPDRRFPSMRHVLRAIEDSMETLDPTGGLFKHKRRYLTKFAQDPEAFTDEMKRSSISAHLDRGYFYQKQGLTKITDAIREFRYVLFLDPDNTKARSAIKELEKQAEESGVRLPKPGTRELPPELAPDTGSPDRGDGTKVLTGGGSPVATQVVRPSRGSGARKPATPAKPAASGAAVRWAGIAVAVLVLAFVGWKLWSGRTPRRRRRSAPSRSRASPRRRDLPSRSRGLRFPRDGDEDSGRFEGLTTGMWEVRLEMDGHKPQLRRVQVGRPRRLCSLAMAEVPTTGQVSLAVLPHGATVRVRRPGTERSATSARRRSKERLSTPERGNLQAEADGHVLTKRVDVTAEQTTQLAWDLSAEFDRGRLEVRSEPSGAAIRVRGPGDSDWKRTGKSTPATLEDLPVGNWSVRLDKNGYERLTTDTAVTKDALAVADVSLTKVEEQAPPPTKTTGGGTATGGDGFAKILIVPFADVYLDGRLFQSEARRPVIPLAAGRTHELELRHPAFGSKKFAGLSPAKGDTLDLGRFDFKWAEVRVFCSPTPVADLLIDGVQVDRQTPFSDKLGAGRHRIAVRKSGWKVAEVVVTGAAGEQRLSPNSRGEVEVEVPADKEVRVQFVLEKS